MKTKVWIVLHQYPNEQSASNLRSWGNGFEFQYPVFHTRREALAWKVRNMPPGLVKIVRAEIKHA